MMALGWLQEWLGQAVGWLCLDQETFVVFYKLYDFMLLAQAVKMKLDTVTLLAQRGDFSQTTAQIVISNIVEMVGDVLCSKRAQEALTTIAELCSSARTAKTAMLLVFSPKNSSIQTKILDLDYQRP